MAKLKADGCEIEFTRSSDAGATSSVECTVTLGRGDLAGTAAFKVTERALDEFLTELKLLILRLEKYAWLQTGSPGCFILLRGGRGGVFKGHYRFERVPALPSSPLGLSGRFRIEGRLLMSFINDIGRRDERTS